MGAFLSIAVAATIAKGLVDAHLVTLELVFAGLVGGIVWNLLTWLLGIPSSSSHALIGGIVGAMLAAVGGHGVIWHGLVSKVMLPALLAPTIALLVATVGTWLVYRVIRGAPEKRTEAGFRYGQIGSASLVSLAHGTNDAQKTMGVIFLALISYGAASSTDTDATAVGDRVVRGRDRAGHLRRRLAGDPHDGQGPGRDQVAAGHGRRVVVGRDHLAVQPLRLRAVHHARRDRLDPGQRGRQARRAGALGVWPARW